MLSPYSVEGVGAVGRQMSKVSYFLSRAGFWMPFAVVIAFVLQKQLSLLIEPVFGGTISHFAFLQEQYAFLGKEHEVSSIDPTAIRLFEMFIWIAPMVSALRLFTGLCSHEVLASSRSKLDEMKKRGLSIPTALIFLLVGAPFVVFCSVNFRFAAASDQALFLMRHFPRAFVCLQAFLFCGGAIFFAEGLLCLVSLLLIRDGRSDQNSQLM